MSGGGQSGEMDAEVLNEFPEWLSIVPLFK